MRLLTLTVRCSSRFIHDQTSHLCKSVKFPCFDICRTCFHSGGSKSPDKFFITTPIFYVNADPHIGHLYSCVLADTAARFQKLQGKDVIFSTGTDEHGQKIQQAAEKLQKSPLDHSTQVSARFKQMFDCYGIAYTDYIRTTEERHKKVVHHFWKLLEEQGHIYKGEYEGWYSVSDEAFLTENDLKDMVDNNGNIIKVVAGSEQPVTWMKEENYMFRLTSFRDQLEKWLKTGAIQPETPFRQAVQGMLSNLIDISVSRESSRLQWGIPVPGDESQKIYVWLDALVNYLTVGGYPSQNYTWPADCHIVGKDILRFHAVFWPAFLMAAGLAPPRKIFCHSHWMVDGFKMSKSRGNVVDPMMMKEKYSTEAFRYYLLREGVPHQDGNFNEIKGMEYVNADLVNTMGNLLSRCTGSSINKEQIFPRKNEDIYRSKFTAADRETFESMDVLIDTVENHFTELQFSKGIESLMSYMRWANGIVQHHEPWVLVKSDKDVDIAHLKTVLHIALETLRVSGIMLQPVIPALSQRLLDRLGVSNDKRTIEQARKPFLNSPEHLPLGPNTDFLRHFNKDVIGASLGQCEVGQMSCSMLNVVVPGETSQEMPAQARELVNRLNNPMFSVGMNNDRKIIDT